LYDAEHFFNPNPINRYSLGIKNKTLTPSDGVCIAGVDGCRVPVCIFASAGQDIGGRAHKLIIKKRRCQLFARLVRSDTGGIKNRR
jgi:hypothetical protein